MDLILCTQKNTRRDILDPKKYTIGLNCVRTISLAEIRTQKNTRRFFRPKNIQEVKILDPKKYVGPPPPPPLPPSRLYPSNPPGGRIFSCHRNEENTKLIGYSSCLVLHLITGYLPETTGTCCFERSNNFMDWHKYIPFPMRLLSTAPSERPETTSGMVQKLLLC